MPLSNKQCTELLSLCKCLNQTLQFYKEQSVEELTDLLKVANIQSATQVKGECDFVMSSVRKSLKYADTFDADNSRIISSRLLIDRFVNGCNYKQILQKFNTSQTMLYETINHAIYNFSTALNALIDDNFFKWSKPHKEILIDDLYNACPDLVQFVIINHLPNCGESYCSPFNVNYLNRVLSQKSFPTGRRYKKAVFSTLIVLVGVNALRNDCLFSNVKGGGIDE